MNSEANEMYCGYTFFSINQLNTVKIPFSYFSTSYCLIVHVVSCIKCVHFMHVEYR